MDEVVESFGAILNPIGPILSLIVLVVESVGSLSDNWKI